MRRLSCAFVLLAIAGCASRPAEPPPPAELAPVSVTFEARYAEAHARADRAIARGELDDATAALTALLDARLPDSPDLAVARRDVYGRLATIALTRKRPDETLALVRRAFAEPAVPSVFDVNLRLAELRAERELGHDAEAERARALAVARVDELDR